MSRFNYLRVIITCADQAVIKVRSNYFAGLYSRLTNRKKYHGETEVRNVWKITTEADVHTWIDNTSKN